jgi:hypothetical protein
MEIHCICVTLSTPIFQTNPVAMAGLRNTHGICPPEVIRFLLDLFKYNDNSKNRFSDNYYRSSLVEALGATVTPVISVVQQGYVAVLMYVSIHMQSISFINLMHWYLVLSFYLSLFFCRN